MTVDRSRELDQANPGPGGGSQAGFQEEEAVWRALRQSKSGLGWVVGAGGMLQAWAQRQERREDRQGLEVRGQGSGDNGPESPLDWPCQCGTDRASVVTESESLAELGGAEGRHPKAGRPRNRDRGQLPHSPPPPPRHLSAGPGGGPRRSDRAEPSPPLHPQPHLPAVEGPGGGAAREPQGAGHAAGVAAGEAAARPDQRQRAPA